MSSTTMWPPFASQRWAVLCRVSLWVVASMVLSLFQAALTEGCRLPVRMHKTDDWPLAEIVSIKELDGRRQFYVHYVDCEYGHLQFEHLNMLSLNSQLTSAWTSGSTRRICTRERCSFRGEMALKRAPAPA